MKSKKVKAFKPSEPLITLRMCQAKNGTYQIQRTIKCVGPGAKPIMDVMEYSNTVTALIGLGECAKQTRDSLVRTVMEKLTEWRANQPTLPAKSPVLNKAKKR